MTTAGSRSTPAPRGLVRFVFLPEGAVRPVITPTVEI